MSASKLPTTGAEQAERYADFLTLPFLADREPTPDRPFGRAFWRNANTGDSAVDNLIGEAWARRLMEHRARWPSQVSLLPGIVRDMVDLGARGGVEVGFLAALEAWACPSRGGS